MKKKNILIAILCVTILLLVPLSNVSGVSVDGLNTKDEVIEDANPVISIVDIKLIKDFQELDIPTENLDEFTLEDFRDFVIKIDLLFGHYPEVAESCENIIEILDIEYPILCELYTILLVSCGILNIVVYNVLLKLGIYNTPFGQAIEDLMFARLAWLFLLAFAFCNDEEQLVNDLDITEIVNFENSNQCPCMYE